MAQSRFFSDVAVDTVLSSGISDSATSVVVGATTGFPASFPYTLVIDPDTASEELVDVQSASGTTLTVIRGYASTGAVTHSAGAVVKHVFTGADATEANAHAGANQNVHGLSGGASLVGTSQTQTLTGKTMDGASNTFQNIPQSAITDLETDLAAALQDADAVPFTPAGQVAATDVQAAIEELDDEKQAVSEKGQNSGYASLNSSGEVPIGQLPVGTGANDVAAGDHTHEHRWGLVATGDQQSQGEITVNDTDKTLAVTGTFDVESGEAIDVTLNVRSLFVNDAQNFSARFTVEYDVNGTWTDLTDGDGWLVNNNADNGRMTGGTFTAIGIASTALAATSVRARVQRVTGSVTATVGDDQWATLRVKRVENLL